MASVCARLEEMSGWQEGWNGYDALPPKPEAIAHARGWVQKLYAELTDVGLPWIDPLVCADGNGNVTFEWWHDRRKITLYLTPNSAEYVRVWGSDVNLEMDEGDANTPESRRFLWSWLAS